MVWVLVFGGIAVAGLVMLICYAVWLAHKASDVMSELAVLGQRGTELGELVAQIQVPGSAAGWDETDGGEFPGDLTADSGRIDRSAT